MDKEFIAQLAVDHINVTHHNLTQARAEKFITRLLSLMFPHLSDKHCESENEIEAQMQVLNSELAKILLPFCKSMCLDCHKISDDFFNDLAQIHFKLRKDAKAIMNMDPAAHSLDEVITCYPGFYAIAVFRIAHWFYSKEVQLMPRILTEYAHKVTGIDIHPGAQIGDSFGIDHGTGIVIGETTVIEDNVKIFQGVTLGGLAVDKEMKGDKRHPTIEKNVIIYANATILGGDTVVGYDSVIGGNVWLTCSVAPNSIVYHKGEVKIKGKKDAKPEPLNYEI